MRDVSALAEAIGRDADEFLRPLTDDEQREWHFYRASARQVTDVWRRVAEASTAQNYSQRRLGELLDLWPTAPAHFYVRLRATRIQPPSPCCAIATGASA